MKRTVIILAPPLAFVLAAAFAWLTGSTPGDMMPRDSANPRGKRRHEIERDSKVNPSTVIRDFERALVLNVLPPKKIHDAEGMEAALKSDVYTASTTAGAMRAMNYSIAWSAEAPEQMFDWLIHQDGDSISRVLFPTYLLFSAWPEKDMGAALASVSKISNPKVRQQALISLVEILCKNDPDRARELMVQNLDLFSPEGGSPIFANTSTGGTTCELLLSLPPGNVRTHLLAKLLRDMTNQSSEEGKLLAASTWKQATEDTRRKWVAAGFSTDKDNTTSFDGLEDLVRQHAEESANPADANQFVTNHGAAWAKRDLTAALDWTQAHLKGEARVDQSAQLFGYAASNDLDTTIASWRQLPSSILKSRAAALIVRSAPDARKAEIGELLKVLTNSKN